jgi:hypothetical protein
MKRIRTMERDLGRVARAALRSISLTSFALNPPPIIAFTATFYLFWRVYDFMQDCFILFYKNDLFCCCLYRFRL